MSGSTILKQTEDHMKKALEVFNEELKLIRTGRPNPEVFKRVRAECYGSMMSVTDLANISVQEGRTFLIQPFDKSTLKAIETAIINSDLGFSPNSDGSVLRINVPPLSEDRRKEMIKQVGKTKEDRGMVVLRNLRREANDQIKALKGSASEDEIKKLQDNLEKLTSKYTDLVEQAAEDKEKELLTV